MTIRRRQFLLGASGVVAAPGLLAGRHREVGRDDVVARRESWMNEGVVPDDDGVLRVRATLNYRTDPGLTRRLLPPMFDVDPKAEVQFNALNTIAPLHRSTVLGPGPDYGEIDISVTCYYEGTRYFTSLPWLLSRDFGRYAGREGAMIRKKDAWIDMDIEDGIMHVNVWRRGYHVIEFAGVPTDEPAWPAYWFRDMGNGELRFDYRLHADWRQGPIAEDPVELWRHFGSDQGEVVDYPDFSKIDEAPPPALDVKQTRLRYPEPSPLDPYAELPIVEVLGGSITTSRRGWAATVPVPRERGVGTTGRYGRPEKRVQLATVDAADMTRFAFSAKAYDPPIFAGKVPVPAGWPRHGSLVGIDDAVVDGWQHRDALVSTGSWAIVDFDLEDSGLSVKMMPGATRANPAQLRLVIGKVEVDDLTTDPFAEAWLLTNIEYEGRPRWFALSHLVEYGGDVITGRETWGWPTKQADSFTWAATPLGVTAGITRLHRRVAMLDIDLDVGARGKLMSLPMDVLGMQSLGITDADNRTGRLINQSWQLELTSAVQADGQAVRCRFPDDPSPGEIGIADAWYEFDGLPVVGAWFGAGEIRRGPGEYVSDRLNSLRALANDRNDGGVRDVRTTFLVN